MSEYILQKRSRKTKFTEGDKKRKENMELADEHLLMKVPDPIIYQYKNRKNFRSSDIEDVNILQHKEKIVRNVEMAKYYLELHMDMISTYNSICSRSLQDIPNTSSDDLPNNKNTYTSLIDNRDDSLKLIDNIITKNVSAFSESIELSQRFYKDVIESVLNCIEKS